MINKKGSLGITIISAIFIFIVGFTVINLLIPEVTDFRVNMNCANGEDITDATKLLCLVGGIAIPYWILLIISISIGGILSRFIF
jgi:hypothetical protein